MIAGSGQRGLPIWSDVRIVWCKTEDRAGGTARAGEVLYTRRMQCV